ncbi:hypothetical protein CLOP_g10173 [Closterium sp. NIES-67]|nr:hypothetical protein CLOP_g10173 [Closterium sp. NIES-67]
MSNAGERVMKEGSARRAGERRGSRSMGGGSENSRGSASAGANGVIDARSKASEKGKGASETAEETSSEIESDVTVEMDSTGTSSSSGSYSGSIKADKAATSQGGRQSGAGPAVHPNRELPMPTLNRARFGLPAICLDLAVLPSGSAGSPSGGSKAAQARAGADGRWARSASSGSAGSSAEEETGEIVGTEEEPMDVRARKQKFLFFEKECSQIMAHVFVGSDAVARDRDILRKSGITHVLNCVGFVCPEYFPGDIIYKTLWLQDNTSEDIGCVLYDVFDFIEAVREAAGRVFVHCCQGVSRSTSLVIAYLMWTEKRGFEDAFRFVKAIRGVASPNMGFACQLLQWQERVLPPSALPPAHPALLDDTGTAEDGRCSRQDGDGPREREEREEREREREREMERVVRVYRMAPHSPYDAVHLVPKMVLEVGPRCLDPRGAFVIQVGRSVYTWRGSQCHALMAEQAERAARQLVTYEGLSLSPDCPSPVLQGAEPAPLLSALRSYASQSDRRASGGGSGDGGGSSSGDWAAVIEREGLTYLGQDAHKIAGAGSKSLATDSNIPKLASIPGSQSARNSSSSSSSSSSSCNSGSGSGSSSSGNGSSSSAGSRDSSSSHTEGNACRDGTSTSTSSSGESGPMGEVAEQQSEYDFDYECFLNAVDGGTPKPIPGLGSPSSKVLPHHGRGWLGATLDDCWASLAAGGGGGDVDDNSDGAGECSERASFRLHSRSFSVGQATLPSLFPVPPSASSSASGPSKPGALSLGADSGGKAGLGKPRFAPVLRKPLPSLPSPSSFSPRSLGFFPPSGVGAYGAALQKYSPEKKGEGGIPGAASTAGAAGAAAGSGMSTSNSGSGSSSSGSGSSSGIQTKAQRGSRLQVSTGGLAGLQGMGGTSGAGDQQLVGRIVVDDMKAVREEEEAEVEEGEEGAGGAYGVQRVSVRGGEAGSRRDTHDAEGVGQGATAQEERRVREPRTRVSRGKTSSGAAAAGRGEVSGTRERAASARDGTRASRERDPAAASSLAAAPSARPLPPKPSLPSGGAPAANPGPLTSSSAAPRSTLPPKGRSASPLRRPRPQQASSGAVPRGGGRGGGVGGMADGLMDGGGGAGDEEEEDGSAEGGGGDLYGVLLTPRRQPPVSAFGRERGTRKGREGGEGGVRRGRVGAEDKWGGDGEGKEGGEMSFGGIDGGFGVTGMDDEGGMGGMGSDDESGGGMAFNLPTPRRGGPQIKKIF